MKIIDLLISIANDGNIPKKIMFKDEVYTYDADIKDYVTDYDDYLFDSYCINEILNDEVQVLEITVTINNNEHTKIEKIDRRSYVLNSVNKILTEEMIVKINALIDRVNDMEV